MGYSMDIITLLFVAVGLAMDAFSVAITSGIVLKKVKILNALKIGLFFGGFQFLMLYIGEFLGSAFSSYITSIDHWIAFVLLMLIGGKMAWDAFFEDDNEEKNIINPLSLKTLTILAIATSIDALAVGVSFAAINVRIIFSAFVVGIVAFIFSFFGVYIGNRCGNLFGNKSEIVGGIVLMGIGIKILIEHLFF